MNKWMDGRWINKLIQGRMKGWINSWMIKEMNKLMNGWINEWMVDD